MLLGQASKRSNCKWLNQKMCVFFWTTVIRDDNVVQLDVDSEVNHVVGPKNPKAMEDRTPVFIGGAPG